MASRPQLSLKVCVTLRRRGRHFLAKHAIGTSIPPRLALARRLDRYLPRCRRDTHAGPRACEAVECRSASPSRWPLPKARRYRDNTRRIISTREDVTPGFSGAAADEHAASFRLPISPRRRRYWRARGSQLYDQQRHHSATTVNMTCVEARDAGCRC